MILMPIVYVQDMEASIAFYERLGFAPKTRARCGASSSAGDGAVLALHKAPPEHVGRVELALVSEEPLERVAATVTRTAASPTRPSDARSSSRTRTG